jgi:hypothetical protein
MPGSEPLLHPQEPFGWSSLELHRFFNTRAFEAIFLCLGRIYNISRMRHNHAQVVLLRLKSLIRDIPLGGNYKGEPRVAAPLHIFNYSTVAWSTGCVHAPIHHAHFPLVLPVSVRPGHVLRLLALPGAILVIPIRSVVIPVV